MFRISEVARLDYDTPIGASNEAVVFGGEVRDSSSRSLASRSSMLVEGLRTACEDFFRMSVPRRQEEVDRNTWKRGASLQNCLDGLISLETMSLSSAYRDRAVKAPFLVVPTNALWKHARCEPVSDCYLHDHFVAPSMPNFCWTQYGSVSTS